MKPPRDPAEVLTERVRKARDKHMRAVHFELGKLKLYRVPQTLIEQMAEGIEVSANTLAWEAESAGEEYPQMRNTVRRTPPDPDRSRTTKRRPAR